MLWNKAPPALLAGNAPGPRQDTGRSRVELGNLAIHRAAGHWRDRERGPLRLGKEGGIGDHGIERRAERREAIGRDFKGKLSLVIYLAAISLAFVDPRMSYALYVAVACIWLVPDRRIERTLHHAGQP